MKKKNGYLNNLLEASKTEKPKYISLLSDEIEKRRLVAFIGAGCSISAGLESWNDLLFTLLKEYNFKTLESNPIKLADRLEMELGTLKFREKIIEKLQIGPNLCSKLHKTLVDSKINLFITTNYDSILEDTFKIKGISPAIISNSVDIPSIDPTRKTIVKLHGDINSPSSLIITSKDYREFHEKSRAFIGFLNSIATQNSILYIGTSFDDPQLQNTDDYAVNLFGINRRSPFIFLKLPETIKPHPDKNYKILLDDFGSRLKEFKSRGFHTILVNKYNEIPDIIAEINSKVIDKIISTAPSNSEMQLNNSYIELLENSYKNLLNEKILDLREKIIGDKRNVDYSISLLHINELIKLLKNPTTQVNALSRFEGEVTVSDGLMIHSNNNIEFKKAKLYYEKAIITNKSMPIDSNRTERLNRLHSKILLFENKIDEAIQVLESSHNPKTQSFWLNFLRIKKRYKDVLEFIDKNKEIRDEWAAEVICDLIFIGNTNQAENIFWAQYNKYLTKKKNNSLDEKDRLFIRNLFFNIISALYNKALELTGKENLKTIYPRDLNDQAFQLIKKALEFIKSFFEIKLNRDLQTDFFSYQIKLIEMNICFFLGEKKETDKIVKDLSIISPINKQVVHYIITEIEAFPKNILSEISARIQKEYTGQSWGALVKAILENYLGENDHGWLSLKQAFEYPILKDDKFLTVFSGIGICSRIGKMNEVLKIIQFSNQFEDNEKKFWEGFCNWQIGNKEDAEKILNELDENSLFPEMKALIRTLKAEIEIQNSNWQKANELLTESIKIFEEPYSLKLQLQVLTNLQDNAAALKTAERIESLGIRDERVIHIKAQTAFNLQQLEKSENAFRELYFEHPDNVEYAYSFARILYVQNQPNEALNVLNKFITSNDHIDVKCLLLASEIYKMEGKLNLAFNIISNKIDLFQDDTALLLEHVDLAYKTANDEKANASLQRLIELEKQGKVSNTAFKKFTIDELKSFILANQKRIEQINGLYLKGAIPRIMLSEAKNIPLFLDWAIRTQNIVLENLEPSRWIDFTIYSTNFLSYDFEKRKLFSIQSPKNAMEFVADYHALITIHQLGLFDKLCKRFKKIYYPKILIQIWKIELNQYHHLQPKRVKIYKSLQEKIFKGEIIQIKALINNFPKDINSNNLNLSKEKNIPLLDNFIEDKNLKDFSNVTIIRLSQIIDWIYENGRLTEKKWRELKRYSKNHTSFPKPSWKTELNEKMKLIISGLTLELMEEFDLIRIISGMGVQLFIEKNTSDEINLNLINIEFGEGVAKNHRDLLEEIEKQPNFIGINIELTPEETAIQNTPYLIALLNSVNYAKKFKLNLWVDDRFIQMQRLNDSQHLQFGTDALLKDLYQNQIINIEEYSEAYLKLCEWRYRFIIPDTEILIYFSKQHKLKLPGDALEKIASYFKQCMKDPGLFMGFEPTNPPEAIGLRYNILVWDMWLQFLFEIWQQDNLYEPDQLIRITKWLFQSASPDLPDGIKGTSREKLNKELLKNIGHKLFIGIINAENHLKLHPFLNIAFDNIYESENEKESELIKYIKFINNFDYKKIIEKKNQNKAIKFFIIKILESIYNGKFNQIKEKIPAKIFVEIPDIQLNSRIDDQTKNEYLEAYKNFPIEKRETSIYKAGPLILLKKDKNKIEYTSLHHDIMCPSVEIKTKVLDRIKESEFITDLSKKKIDLLKDKILFSTPIFSLESSQQIKNILLRDFKYIHSLWRVIEDKPELGNILINEIWEGTKNPELETAKDIDSPMFSDNLEQRQILNKIENRLSEMPDISKINSNSNWSLNNDKFSFLDWYLDKIFFVPIGSQLSPGNILNTIIGIDKNRKRKKTIDFKDYYYEIKDWIDNKSNSDPLAYIMALDILLNLRSNSEDMTEQEKELFQNEVFFHLIKKILAILLNFEDEQSIWLVNTINSRWEMRFNFAKYYLMYIDLNSLDSSMIDEEKIIRAWWMAKKTEETFFKLISKGLIPKNLVSSEIKTITSQITRFHWYKYRKTKTSIARYFSLFEFPKLSSLALSLIAPPNNAFNGIMKPSKAFISNFVDSTLEKTNYNDPIFFENPLFKELLNPINLNTSQISSGEKSIFKYLWETPINESIPSFFRTYYKDAFKYFGQNRIEIVEYAEALAKPDFLNKQMIHFSDFVDSENGINLYILLEVFHCHFLIHGTIPSKELSIVKNETNLISKILKFKAPMNILCLKKTIEIFQRLVYIGHSEGANVFRNIINEFYSNKIELPEEILAFMIPDLIDIIILNNDLDLLSPFLKEKKSNHLIKKILGKLKTNLEFIFTQIPLEYRENLKRILFELSDIQGLENNMGKKNNLQ